MEPQTGSRESLTEASGINKQAEPPCPKFVFVNAMEPVSDKHKLRVLARFFHNGQWWYTVHTVFALNSLPWVLPVSDTTEWATWTDVTHECEQFNGRVMHAVSNHGPLRSAGFVDVHNHPRYRVRKVRPGLGLFGFIVEHKE